MSTLQKIQRDVSSASDTFAGDLVVVPQCSEGYILRGNDSTFTCVPVTEPNPEIDALNRIGDEVQFVGFMLTLVLLAHTIANFFQRLPPSGETR